MSEENQRSEADVAVDIAAAVAKPDRIKAAAKAKITARCRANVKGWGQVDSVAVILAMSAVEQPWSAEEAASFHAFVDYTVNPSACRQRLEGAKLLEEEKGKGKARKANLMA